MMGNGNGIDQSSQECEMSRTRYYQFLFSVFGGRGTEIIAKVELTKAHALIVNDMGLSRWSWAFLNSHHLCC